MSVEKFTDRARQVVVLALKEARNLQHDYIGAEHILLGLLGEGEGVAAQTLTSLNLVLGIARFEVEELVKQGEKPSPNGHLPFTDQANNILHLAENESLRCGVDYIGTEHILLGLLRQKSVATQILIKRGLALEDVRNKVFEILGQEQPAPIIDEDPEILGATGAVVGEQVSSSSSPVVAGGILSSAPGANRPPKILIAELAEPEQTSDTKRDPIADEFDEIADAVAQKVRQLRDAESGEDAIISIEWIDVYLRDLVPSLVEKNLREPPAHDQER